MVAGGNKQRNHIDKTDATSPIAALEYVLLTATIDAKEGRDVAIVDIPNAFVTTCIEKKDDIATIRLRGKLAELMVATTSEIYNKYVTVNRKGELVFFLEALNAIYGIMKAALLFYIKFVENLQSIGSQMNPYDPCVANNIVNSAQPTVVWHFDDLKVSHVVIRADKLYGRDIHVAIVNIPNAFVTTRIGNKANIVTIRLQGKLAELMVATVPEIYNKYVTVNRKGDLVI